MRAAFAYIVPIFLIDVDILVMKSDEEPNYMWGAQVTSPDGRYLALYVSRDTARVSFVSHVHMADRTEG